MTGLDRRGAVFVLTLGDDENRFHPDRLVTINAALDEVEAADGPKAVVTTGAGKFYSNGLDLDFMASNPDAADSNLNDVHALFARVLAFPATMVAALQGHAFAAGAMLALAHDLRRDARRSLLLCLPEVDLGIPFTAGMNALPAATGGEGEVLDLAVARAEELAAKAGPVLGAIKSRLYAEVVAELTTT